MSRILNLFRNLLGKKRAEQLLDEEILSSLEMLIHEGIAAGLSEDEARRAARLELGSIGSLKDSVRDVRAGAAIEQIWRDFRYAMRGIRHRPGFTAVAVVVLTLGIGTNSAVFSLLNAILLKPLSVSKPEELIGVYSRDTKHPDNYRLFSYPNYVEIRDHNRVFSNLMAENIMMAGLKEGDQTRRVFTGLVSSNYFSTLGVSLIKGRPFTTGEEKPGRDLAVIVTYPFWRRTGEDAHIVGKQLQINDHLFTIIGVTPKGFTGTTALFSPDMYVPIGAYDIVANDGSGHVKPLSRRDNDALLVAGRLKPGITQRQADANLDIIASQMAKAFPAENKNWTLVAGPLSRLGMFDRPADDSALNVPALLLVPLAGIVLLIACLNLANMMMARGAARRSEIAIRLAIGGSRYRILQQLATEGLILSILGGAGGLLAASWGTTLLVTSLIHVAAPIDIVYNSAPDVRVLAATLAFCAVSTIVFALFPAWKLSKLDAWIHTKATTGEDVGAPRRRLFSRSNVLVMAQLSLSLMMVATAGLFVRSAVRAANIQPGFSLDNEELVEVDASLINYDEVHARQLYRTLRQHLKRIPDVQSVGMAATVPWGIKHLAVDISPEQRLDYKEHPIFAEFNIVTGDYFRTLNIPLLQGRSFLETESAVQPNKCVAIIDKLAADELWGNGKALGKQIRLDQSGDKDHTKLCEVVGVVNNVRDHILGGKADAHVYIPYGQQYEPDMQIHVKVAVGGAEANRRMLEIIRHEIQVTDARLPLLSLTTLRSHLESGMEIWVVRTGAHILEIFGGAALFLAVIGLYAVNAHTVARRTREIGIRMALGADISSTLRMILADGLRVTAVGIGTGLLLAIGIGHLLAGFLYGVEGNDPAVLAAASGVLAIVALCACYVPARRASRVDPMMALRFE